MHVSTSSMPVKSTRTHAVRASRDVREQPLVQVDGPGAVDLPDEGNRDHAVHTSMIGDELPDGSLLTLDRGEPLLELRRRARELR